MPSEQLISKLAEGGTLAIIVALQFVFIFFLVKALIAAYKDRVKDEGDRTEKIVGVLTKFQDTADILLKAAGKV